VCPKFSANESPTAEVVNVVLRRRWTIAEKHQVIEEPSLIGMSVSFVTHKFGIALNDPAFKHTGLPRAGLN
jgi:transposase